MAENEVKEAKEGEEKLEVEVLDDTPEQDRGRARRNPEAPPPNIPPPDSEDDLQHYSEGVRQRIKRLRYEYHEERRAKEAALRQNDEAVKYAKRLLDENNSLKSSLTSKEKDLIELAKAKVDAEVASAKQRLQKSLEEGLHNEAVSAQEALAAATARGEMLSTYKPPEPQRQPVQQPLRAQDYAPEPRAVEWMRNNPWFGKDKEMTGYAYGVHEKLITEERILPTSEQYYARIDEALRHRFPEKFESEEDKRNGSSEPNRSSSSSAPTRTVVAAPSRAGTTPRKVQIPASAAAVAKRLGIPLELYAEHYVKEYGNG